MFRGIAAINIDDKGRMAIPARYRQLLQDFCDGKLIVTIDTDVKCLLLYPLSEWENIETKLQTLPSFNQAARRIQRLLIGHATELEMDSNGRFLLPALLRDYANLDKRVMLVGQGKKFEIWSDFEWETSREAWLAKDEKNAHGMPEELHSLAL